MIRKLFLIQESGVCIYYIDFSEIKTNNPKGVSHDPQLISGFFTAIMAFGETAMDEKGDELNYICFKNLNYYFRRHKTFFVVFELDSNTNLGENDISELIRNVVHIYEEFICKGVFEENACFFAPSEEFEQAIRDEIAKLMRRNLFKKFT
jgi:hypothetical protein